MRKIKRRKTQLIHSIREIWQSTERGKEIKTREELEFTLAIMCTLIYLDIFDAIKTDRQKELFKKSHLSTYNNKSNVQLSLIYNICEDTISDYCSMHIKIFEQSLAIAKSLTGVIDYKKERLQLRDIVEVLVQNRAN